MAIRKAIASGNWSDPAIWDGGVAIPDVGDDVYSNTFTVVVDGSYTVLSVRNTTATGVSAGGSFTLQDGYTLTADMYANGPTCLNWSGGAGTSTTVIGNVSNTSNGRCITHSGVGGTLNIVGNITLNGNDAGGVLMSGTGGNLVMIGNISVTSNGSIAINCSGSNHNITVTGNIINNSSSSNCRGIQGNTNTTATVIGNVTGGANASLSPAIYNCTTISVTGNVYGGTLGAAINTSITSAYVTVVGAVYACTAPTASGAAIICAGTTQYVFLSGPFISSTYGWNPLLVYRFFMIPMVNTYYELRDNSTAGSLAIAAPTYSLYPLGTAGDVPVESDVREGVTYEFSAKTGTLIVPPTNAVSVGVPVDDTIGTAWLDPQQFVDVNAAQIAAFLNNL